MGGLRNICSLNLVKSNLRTVLIFYFSHIRFYKYELPTYVKNRPGETDLIKQWTSYNMVNRQADFLKYSFPHYPPATPSFSSKLFHLVLIKVNDPKK